MPDVTDKPQPLNLTPDEELLVIADRLKAHAERLKEKPQAAIRLELASDMVRSAKYRT